MNKEQIRHLLNLISPPGVPLTIDSRLTTAEHNLSLVMAVLQSHLQGDEELPRYYPPAEPYHEKKPFTYNDFKLTCDMVNEAAGLATARSGNNEDND